MGRFAYSRVENIVMTANRSSFLVRAIGEDCEYVFGHYCDIRGMIVNTTVTKFAKREIALRIKVGTEYDTQLPGHRQLTFDHHTKEYVGLD